ncbi:MAG: hypothetical protein OEM46_07560 [Ignavibacteria bacterium]|nr:hypothetical protein [Ignavibacteria bacterium]
MYKKLIASVLVVALLNLFGCYSFEAITVPEYEQVEKEEGKPGEIYVKTKDSQEYHFSESNFYIENDTLYGKEISLQSEIEPPFEGKFALTEIKSIQLEDFGQKYPSLMTVSQYQKIEAESGKPDEFYFTKIDSTKYRFMKNDYHIEKDTLYGKGFLILDKEQPLVRKIALSNIAFIEVDSINWLNTSLLSLGIAVVAFILFLVIAYASGATKHWGP